MSVQLHPDIETLDKESLCYSIYAQLYHNFFNAQLTDLHPPLPEPLREKAVPEAVACCWIT